MSVVCVVKERIDEVIRMPYSLKKIVILHVP